MKDKHLTIDISLKTVAFTVFFLIGLYILYLILDIVLVVFIAMLFTAAVNPLVTRLEKRNIPRGLSIALVYLLVFGTLVTLIAAVVPPFVHQLAILIKQISIPKSIIQNLKLSNINLQDLDIIANQVTSVPKIIAAISSAFTGIVILLTTSVISFYMLFERKNLHKHLVWVLGKNTTEKKAEDFINTFEQQVGSWVRGQLFLMFIIGFTTYIGLTLLQVPFALPLAIIAGLLEMVPNIGPTLAAIPAIIIAYLTMSPAMSFAVLALYILIQQLENNFIVPYVMKKTINLNPIVTIVLILIGFRLGGVIGAIIAIPIFLVFKIFLTQWRELRNSRLGSE